jgi:hypothetical protein
MVDSLVCFFYLKMFKGPQQLHVRRDQQVQRRKKAKDDRVWTL